MISYYYKLIYFLPLALITGPFFPDLIVTVCSVLFLIDTFRLKLFSYYHNNFFKFFMIFFLFLNLSSIFAENLIPFKYSLGYIRYGIFSILLFYTLKNYSNFKYNFSKVFVAVFLFIIIDSYIQYFFGRNIFLIEVQRYWNGLEYVTGVFGEEKKLGSFLSRLTPIFLISILYIGEQYKLKTNFLTLIFISWLFILILYTTERTSIVIMSTFLILVFLSYQTIISKITSLTSLALLIFIVLIINPELTEKLKSTFYQMGILHPGYAAHSNNNNIHDDILMGNYPRGVFIFSKFYHDQIISSLIVFKDNILFGIGAKNYKMLQLGGWHPHNFHAQILVEIGIFAYLILVSTFLLFFKETVKILFIKKTIKQEDVMKNFIIFIIFINLIPIPTGDFFNNWLNIIIYLPVGFLLYLNEEKI